MKENFERRDGERCLYTGEGDGVHANLNRFSCSTSTTSNPSQALPAFRACPSPHSDACFERQTNYPVPQRKRARENGEVSTASGDISKLKSRSPEHKPFSNSTESITPLIITSPGGFFKGISSGHQDFAKVSHPSLCSSLVRKCSERGEDRSLSSFPGGTDWRVLLSGNGFVWESTGFGITW